MKNEDPTDWTRQWVYLTISWRNTASALAPGFSCRALAATWLVSPLSSTTFSSSSFFSNSLECWEPRGLSEVFFSSTWVPGSRGRPLLHSSVLTVSGPGLVFSRAAFLGTDAAMRIRVISWRRLHVKRGHSQHSHSPGLALLHKDGGDSPSSLLPHILYPFLLSMICPQIPESQNAGSGRDLEDHLVQLFSTGNHWVLPSPGDIWQCLETLLVVATRWGKWLLISSGQKPGTLLNILQSIRQTPTVTQSKMSVVLRLRNLVLIQSFACCLRSQKSVIYTKLQRCIMIMTAASYVTLLRDYLHIHLDIYLHLKWFNSDLKQQTERVEAANLMFGA